jgi:hypothetical protein
MATTQEGMIDAPTLEAAAKRYARRVENHHEGRLPEDLGALVDLYDLLGQAVSASEAALVGALDAVDPTTGLSDEEKAPYQRVIPTSFQVLRDCGELFARLDGPFSQLVHGGGGWPNRPVDHGEKTLYENTFKTRETLSSKAREDAYQSRVERFMTQGGEFSDITLLDSESLRALKPWSHFDYVMLPNYETRVYPTAEADRGGKPKAGHSLLIGTDEAFVDRHVLSAGELWVLKDYTGELEAVVIANNSGHFKPGFKDLPNTLEGLRRLGVEKDRVVLFGGPNNISAIFREIGEIHGIGGLDTRMAPEPTELLASWQ